MKLGIAHRFALIFSVLVFVATATAGYMVYQGSREALIEAATDRLAHTAEVIEVQFRASLDAVSRDVRFLAKTPPVQGIGRLWRIDHRGFALDPQTAMSDQDWRDQMAEVFEGFLENRPSYLAISFVRAGSGQEFVRMMRRGADLYRVPRAELQQIGEGAHFQEATSLPQGDVYLSDIELTEGADGLLPRVMVGLPVYNQAGDDFGLVLIEVNLWGVLNTLRELAVPDKDLYIANESGELLVKPDTAHQISLGPGTLGRIQVAFPEAAPVVNGDTTSVRIKTAEVDKGVVGSAYFVRVPFSRTGEPNTMILGVTSPHEAILSGVRAVRNRSILITLFFGIGGIVLALALSGLLTRPLSAITRAVSHFGRDGWESSLPVERQDELGMLSRTFLKMAEQIQLQVIELESKEHRQRTILETSAEGIIVTNAEGKIETFNKAAEHILGYSAQEVMGSNIGQYIQPYREGETTVVPGDVETVWRAQEQGGEAVGRRKNADEVPLSITWSSFQLGGATKYTFLLQDITERKADESLRNQLLDELKKERIRLKRLSESLEVRVARRTTDLARTNKVLEQRNRELQDFAYVASHDLQEPLRKIRAFSGLLEAEYGAKIDEEGGFYIQRMQDAATRMSSLITDLLAFSRVTTRAHPYELVDLTRIAEEVLSDLEISVQEGGGEVTIHPLPTIEADPTQMRQLLQNLIANALKFHRPDVPPVIEVRGVVEEIGRLPGLSGPACRLEVEDNGIGFEEKHAERIFSPFQRLHGRGEYQGTGMGLAICRRIIERHEGTIVATSEPGLGTTFIVRLPVYQRRNAEGESAEVDSTMTVEE